MKKHILISFSIVFFTTLFLCSCISNQTSYNPLASPQNQEDHKTVRIIITQGRISISGSINNINEATTGKKSTPQNVIKKTVYTEGQVFICNIRRGEQVTLHIQAIQKKTTFSIIFAGREKNYNAAAGKGFNLEQTLSYNP